MPYKTEEFRVILPMLHDRLDEACGDKEKLSAIIFKTLVATIHADVLLALFEGPIPKVSTFLTDLRSKVNDIEVHFNKMKPGKSWDPKKDVMAKRAAWAAYVCSSHFNDLDKKIGKLNKKEENGFPSDLWKELLAVGKQK